MRRASRLQTAVRVAPNPRERLVSLRYLLARVRLDELAAVRDARKAGMTWKQIADTLQLTESGARKRYVAKGIE
jgi:hypothetical protein